ncbi:uncharacterized protein [Arachis hypogaea]|uniref:uncharacterized protein n=1 Tax=Arachis hypogaea TaxID=3818 RepID=UPI000DED04B2|nr:uncharacterized protein LOC112733699 [Arachis hypogaea]
MLVVEGALSKVAPNATAPTISFEQSDYQASSANLDDPVVISIQVGELLVRKVLLDPGSSADVLFLSNFKKMKLSEKYIQLSAGELAGFSGKRVPVISYIWLKTTLGEPPLSKTKDIQYLIVECTSPYNIILGRPSLNSFDAIISTIHLCVKFHVQDNQVATIHFDLKEA